MLTLVACVVVPAVCLVPGAASAAPACGSVADTVCWQPYVDAVDACQPLYAEKWQAGNCCTFVANADLKACALTELGCDSGFDDSDPALSCPVCEGNLDDSSCWSAYAHEADGCQALYWEGSRAARDCCTYQANASLNVCLQREDHCVVPYDTSHPEDVCGPSCNGLLTDSSCWAPFVAAADACQPLWPTDSQAANCCAYQANRDLWQCAQAELGCDTGYDLANPGDYCPACGPLATGSSCMRTHNADTRACSRYAHNDPDAYRCCVFDADLALKECRRRAEYCDNAFDPTLDGYFCGVP